MDSKTMMDESKDKIRGMVKEKYSSVAKGNAVGCAPSCCGGPPSLVNILDLGNALEYGEKDLSLAPGEANLGSGCEIMIHCVDLPVSRNQEKTHNNGG